MKKFWREQKNWDNLSQFRGNGILALDRGNDDENTIGFLQSNGYFAVVRQRHERYIFGNAKTIAQNLREAVPAKTILIKNGKNIRGSVRFKLGQMALAGPILAVESQFENVSITLFVTHPNLACANEKELEKIAQSEAQAYLDRWGIETFFRELKQNFKIEEARPRTFRALNNLFMLSILAHYFVKDFRSRPSRELSKITKLIKDNFSQINSKTFSFLQNLRALFCEKSLKFISVRPKKPPQIAPKQLIFPFYPA